MSYDRLVREIVATDPAGCWELTPGAYWQRVSPSRSRTRMQGWKVHVSAVPVDAEPILRAATGVLVARSVPFKYVATAELLLESLGRQKDPSASGKFITAYPDSDGQFTELLDELHAALGGFRGPRILSDRQYRGGIVHYRYGQITGYSRFDDQGVRQELIMAPDGSLTPDRRRGWFSAPDWAGDPVGDRPAGIPATRREPDSGTRASEPTSGPASARASSGAGAGAGEALIAGRYRVTATIRHSNRGGVHRATDTETGRPVVIKHCRAWIEPEPDGTDTRDLLRHEAAMLRRLAGAIPLPELVQLFDLGENTFLVETELLGRPLRELIVSADDDAEPLPEERIVDLARQLLSVLRAAHRHGVVIGDVTPDNFLVAPDGRLQLIDLEGAAETGRPIPQLSTKGYAPPEKVAAERGTPLLATEAMDRYAVGAVLESLCLQRPRDARPGDVVPGAASLLDLFAEDGGAVSRLAPVVRGLTREDPGERWSWERAERALAGQASPARQAAPGTPVADCLPTRAATPTSGGVDSDQLIHDVLLDVLNALRPQGEELIAMRGANSRLDPRFVQAGAAGVTGVLLQAQRALPRMPAPYTASLADALHEALGRLNRWWDRNLGGTDQNLLPGLHNGFAGACWAAVDAAQAADDPITLDHALGLAERLPTRWHIPTIAHGLAGTGITLLHLWHATGETAFRTRARDCAEFLVQAAVADGVGGLYWPAETGKSAAYHGFAVGTAGIGHFLLAAADACQQPDFAVTASRAGDGLVAAALTRELPARKLPARKVPAQRFPARDLQGAASAAGPDGEPVVAAWWPESPAGGPRRHGWWAGAAGIGAFLLRLGRHTGRPVYLDTARAAAAAVRHPRPARRWGPSGASPATVSSSSTRRP